MMSGFKLKDIATVKENVLNKNLKKFICSNPRCGILYGHEDGETKCPSCGAEPKKEEKDE